MAKLQDLFAQARRTQSGSGMGFLGKNRAEAKPHSAALVVAFSQVTAGSSEAMLKAGADGLLFSWDGANSASLEALKKEVDSVKSGNEQIVCGVHITGNWERLNNDSFTKIKDQGIQYVVLPFDSPAPLLAIEEKDLEKVVTIPMRKDDMYPIFIRNLTAFEHIVGVELDFGLTSEVGSMTIEDILHYRAVREAVRFPALLKVNSDITEAEAYTINTLGVQAVILDADEDQDKTREQVKHLRQLLEKVYQEDKERDLPSLRR